MSNGSGLGFLDEILFADSEARMTQSAESELLELADPLTGQIELIADLLERARHAVVETVSEGQDAAFAHRQTFDRLPETVRDVQLFGNANRVDGFLIFNEVAELSAVLANRLLERHRIGNAERQLDLGDVNPGLYGDLFWLRVASELRLQARLGSTNGCERVVQMDRDPNRSRLVGDGTSYGLPNPPGCIRRELETLAPVELLDGTNQSEVAFLDEIEEVDARGVGVATSVGNDESEIGREERILGLLTAPGLTPKSDLFGPALEIALIKPIPCRLAGFDLLGEIDLRLGRQQLVLADRRQVLDRKSVV